MTFENLLVKAIAGKMIEFWSGKSYFYGKIQEAGGEKEKGYILIRDFTSGRSYSHWETSSTERKKIFIPLDTVIRSILFNNVFVFKFEPWPSQGKYRAFICAPQKHVYVRSYCRKAKVI